MRRFENSAPASRGRLLAAHASLYLIWGSTYLAIRFAIETLPPFFMSSVRFALAGSLLLGYQWARGRVAVTAAHWRSAIVVGTLLLLFGNGGVAWAEQYAASGLVALTVAIVPIWMTLFDWVAGGPRPTRPLLVGLALGLAGVAVLIGPEEILGEGATDPRALAAVVMGSVAWAVGSIYSRSAPMPRSALTATAMQMICGSVALMLAAIVTGELPRVELQGVSAVSFLAWAYLVLFGSIIAYSSYVYLLRSTAPAKASTYAYVNPVIAVVLGWALASEPINARTLLAVLMIVPAVALVVSFRATPRMAAPRG